MIPVPNSQHLSSGGLALLVHGLFFSALVYGLTWKTLPQLPVQADLWAELPSPPPPPPAMVIPPEPQVEPAPPPPEQADIALEKAKKLKLAEQRKQEERRQAELKTKAEAAKKAQAEKLKAEQLKIEQARLEQERLEKERLAKEQMEKERLEKEQREAKRRQFEQELARVMRDSLATENSQLKAAQDHARAVQQTRLVKDFRERIMLKIRANVRLPQNLSGNPEAEFQVRLLPNGEVLKVMLIKSSGQRLYDQEVERAILKSSPLPLPQDREAAALFRDSLSLKFRPQD